MKEQSVTWRVWIGEKKDSEAAVHELGCRLIVVVGVEEGGVKAENGIYLFPRDKVSRNNIYYSKG